MWKPESQYLARCRFDRERRPNSEPGLSLSRYSSALASQVDDVCLKVDLCSVVGGLGKMVSHKAHLRHQIASPVFIHLPVTGQT